MRNYKTILVRLGNVALCNHELEFISTFLLLLLISCFQLQCMRIVELFYYIFIDILMRNANWHSTLQETYLPECPWNVIYRKIALKF